jgi:hypothetical protein
MCILGIRLEYSCGMKRELDREEEVDVIKMAVLVVFGAGCRFIHLQNSGFMLLLNHGNFNDSFRHERLGL